MIWTDAIQTFFIVVGLLAMFLRTLVLVGGWGRLNDALEDGKRLNFFEYVCLREICATKAMCCRVFGEIRP